MPQAGKLVLVIGPSGVGKVISSPASKASALTGMLYAT
jgi:ribose 1,5-bisphosphokinase PhnN